MLKFTLTQNSLRVRVKGKTAVFLFDEIVENTFDLEKYILSFEAGSGPKSLWVKIYDESPNSVWVSLTNIENGKYLVADFNEELTKKEMKKILKTMRQIPPKKKDE